MNYEFITPKGLKIRLNYKFFMRFVTDNVKNELSEDEILNDYNCQGAFHWIETMFSSPEMLIWTFTIIAAICKIVNPIIFFVIAIMLAFIGYINAVNVPFLLRNIMYIISIPYSICTNTIVRFIAVCLIIFFSKTTFWLLGYYLIATFLWLLIEIICNNIVSGSMKKKYDWGYNDTEVCAINIFAMYSHSKLGMNESDARRYFFGEYSKYAKSDT